MESMTQIGENTIIEDGAEVGYQYHDSAGPTRIGKHGIIRKGAIIYRDVIAGDYLQTGHYAVIRPFCRLGDYCTVFHRVVLEGMSQFGDGVRLMAGVYVPSRSSLGNHVFVGPGTMLLNDKYPGRAKNPETPKGPTIEDEVVVGGGCTIGPGVTIGSGSFIAAGTLVMQDVPPGVLALGTPMQLRDLPAHLEGPNSRSFTESKFDIWHPNAEMPGDAKW